ncbi:MAG: IS1182 family transposase [Patescibacteria group bacterium]
MPKFKLYNQNQSMLLPPNVKDCLPAYHICHAINDVVDNLDISCIEQTYSENGAPAYNPRMLIKIMFFSYIRGIRSSRKIEELAVENIVFRYLSANQQPDHGTINLFRKSHLENLEKIFAQIVRLCDGLKIIDPTDISIDGSVFKANASRKATHGQEEIDKLKKKIRKMLEEAENIDRQEDKKYGEENGYNEMPERLKDPKTRQEEIKRLLNKLSKLETADQAIKEKQQTAETSQDKILSKNKTSNTTDPDANLMKLKIGKVYKPAYNGQIATSNQIITAYDIVEDEPNSLLPMIELAENNTGKKVEKVKADSGYFSKQNITDINEKQIDAYIPDQRKAMEENQERNNEIPKYDRRNFAYNKDKDEFICPQNQCLPLVRTDQGTKKYIGTNCSCCPVKTKCAKGKNRYISYDPELEQLKTTMREKLNTKEGKAKYLGRMSDIEPVFGNIIYNQKANNFLCRGKPKVKIEFGLACIAHNLVKISNWIKKEKKNIKEMQLNTLMRLPATA